MNARGLSNRLTPIIHAICGLQAPHPRLEMANKRPQRRGHTGGDARWAAMARTLRLKAAHRPGREQATSHARSPRIFRRSPLGSAVGDEAGVRSVCANGTPGRPPMMTICCPLKVAAATSRALNAAKASSGALSNCLLPTAANSPPCRPPRTIITSRPRSDVYRRSASASRRSINLLIGPEPFLDRP
jgi:hypothetical protein